MKSNIDKTKLSLLFFALFINYLLQSQQNFINVPSSEATTKHKLFFQQQINFNEIIQSNTTLDFGLGKGFEIGANVLGLNFSEKNKSFIKNDTNDIDPYNPLVMLNGLKQFELSENISISTGTQLGLNFRDNKKNTEASLIYGNLLLKNLLIKNSSLVAGTYYNSLHYGGRNGNRVGAWIGTELPIINKIHIVAESVIGNNALSYTSLGLIYYPKKRIPITVGIQIPNVKSNAYSIVFELTFVP
ncbi:MAG TPA: hypothetical protein PKZ75_10155 [Bacteroidia bacterium]|nr:hypothetical protein [Bacteroidia bacterium]